jgi:HPt (histidine-containing phosphotransfer) domain-containing protein
MIDKDLIRENLRYYDKSVVAQIIDLFIDECPIRFENLRKSIEEIDFESIDEHAHSLKGVVAYLSPEIFELASKLEHLGKDRLTDGLQQVFDELRTGTFQLVTALREMRNEYDS